MSRFGLGRNPKLDKPWLLQRHTGDNWFDADGFETKDAAVKAIAFARSQDAAAIRGAGGENWSGRRLQKMRIVHVVSA